MRLLVIRFSSFGDIVQAIAVPQAFREAFPSSTVDWLTREDFKELLEQQPSISNVISFSRSSGLSGLVGLAFRLSREGYTHIYDAHSNLRSTLLVTLLRALSGLRFLRGQGTSHFAKRPKDRMRRFLFFKLRWNTLPRPFRGADSFHRPLVKWGLKDHVPQGPQFHLKSEDLPAEVESGIANLRSRAPNVIALAASAAWEMKRWPVEHWKMVIASMPTSSFLLLGGKEDQFLEDLKAIDPTRVLNLAGRLSLDQSSAVLLKADLVIANDTGLLHVADQMNRPTIALIGPTAFGYPSHPTSLTMEKPLFCQPCSKDGRGGCVNSLYKRCLVELAPADVVIEARKLLIAAGRQV
jgi:ADP-heptose:LPS heptosyltransferase